MCGISLASPDLTPDPAADVVLSRVVAPCNRTADGVVDVEIAREDGSVEVLTVTPEHPVFNFEVAETLNYFVRSEGSALPSLHTDTVLISRTLPPFREATGLASSGSPGDRNRPVNSPSRPPRPKQAGSLTAYRTAATSGIAPPRPARLRKSSPWSRRVETPAHHTVLFPEPVTDEVAEQFNTVYRTVE